MRLSDLFDLVLANIKKNKYDISNISKRIIKIRNKEQSKYFDLGMFYANGDYFDNPYINAAVLVWISILFWKASIKFFSLE